MNSKAQVFRSTRVVIPGRVVPANVIVENGKIVAVDEGRAAGQGMTLHDFGSLVLMPGLVDAHVHINDPGRTEWEGFITATTAAAAGGVTLLVDMPLNCVPEVTTVEALEAKRAAARGNAWVDWAAWGGVVPGNAANLNALVNAGVPGFKCFLIDSGIDGFKWVDEMELRLALEKLRGTALPLLAHAENPNVVSEATDRLNEEMCDWRKYATYLASRPNRAETEAIALLVRLAEEFRIPIHIVHLSSAEALPMLAEARGRGVPITVETCPHYLTFAAEDIPDDATEYKCAPPIRSAGNREKLWRALLDGDIDFVVTDHSPCPPAMKRREEGRWDKAWGGISSLGLTLPVLWDSMQERGMGGNQGLMRISRWLSEGPARLSGMHKRKGALQPGCDADFAVFDPDAEWAVSARDLHFRHKLSPYLGRRLRGRVKETWLRGRPIFRGGHFEGTPEGRECVRT